MNPKSPPLEPGSKKNRPKDDDLQSAYNAPPHTGMNAPDNSGAGPRSGNHSTLKPSDKAAYDESPPGQKGFYNAGGDNTAASRDNLRQAEGDAAAGDEGGLYTEDGPLSKRERVGNFMNRHPKAIRRGARLADWGILRYYKKHSNGVLYGGGAGAGIFVTLFVAFFTLMPLKIEHMVENLQKHFFASAEEALDKTTQRMLRKYMVRYASRDYLNCGTTLSNKCKVNIFNPGRNPVAQMYRAWSQNRIENQLGEKGIYFQRRGDGNFYMRGPGIGREGINMGRDASQGDRGWYHADNRPEFKRALKVATEDLTLWKKTTYRYKAGRLASVKDGVVRCLFYCKITDAKNDFLDDKKNRAKIAFTQKVIMPRDQTLGIGLLCIFEACDATHAEVGSEDADILHGDPENPEVDKKAREEVARLASQYGKSYVNFDEATKLFTHISERGFQHYLVTELVAKVVSRGTALTIANGLEKWIPVIGQLDLLFQVVHMANEVGPTIKKISYVTNSIAAVQTYMMFRSYADEVHTGKANPKELGQVVGLLGKGDYKNKTDPIRGGSATAEDTPLYQSIMRGESSKGSDHPNYLCNDGNRVPDGQMVCDEEVITGGNAIANGLKKYLNSCPVANGLQPGSSEAHEAIGQEVFGDKHAGYLLGPCPVVVTWVAGVWNAVRSVTIGLVEDGFADVLGEGMKKIDEAQQTYCDATGFFDDIVEEVTGAGGVTPGAVACQYRAFMKKNTEKMMPIVFKMMTELVIPNPFSTNMSGGRMFDMMAMGADTHANDFTQISLGGKRVDDAVAAQIREKRKAEERDAFQAQPFYARMFDTENEHSLVSQMAMAVPIDMQSSATNQMASIVSNPLEFIGKIFSSIIPINKALAATADGVNDPFGIPQYAYPLEDIPEDPEEFWTANCDDDKPEHGYQNDAYYARAPYNQEAADNIDEETGLPTNKNTNPCLLIKAATGAAGAIFDQDLLTEGDRADINPGYSDSPSDSGTAGEKLDKATMFKDSSNVDCAANTKDVGVHEGYHGGKKVQIRVCAVSNFPSTGEESNGGFGVKGADGKCVVNSRASGAVYAMVEAAKKDKVTLSANSCFRTMEHQKSLFAANPNPARVARPGYSNHQMGLALDIKGLPSDPSPGSGPIWDWLSKNAKKYGYKNYKEEQWHWSGDGS